MRLSSCAVALFFCSSVCFSQIPNAGFETWVDDGNGNVNPAGWETNNSSPYVTVDSVTPGHSGAYAMRVKTVDLGVVKLPGAAILEAGYAFTQTPARFGAWLKSTIMQGDTALIIVGLMKGDSIVAATGDCTFKIDSSYTQYTYREFPIAIISSLIPDSMYIMVATSLTGNPQVGTEIIVDDFVFLNSVTSMERDQHVPGSFSLAQNYPNPFNPKTTISYQISEAGRVILKIFDVLGREVATLVDQIQIPGIYQAEWNMQGASGVYFYRLEAVSSGRTFVETKKMAIVR